MDSAHLGLNTFHASDDPSELLRSVGLIEGADFLLDEEPEEPIQHSLPLPPILAPKGSARYAELARRGRLLRDFAEDLHGGEFWVSDALCGPLPEQKEREGWALTRSLAFLQLDHLNTARLYVMAFQLYQPTALDLFKCAINGGWGYRLSYAQSDLDNFRAHQPKPQEDPPWLSNRTAPYGFMEEENFSSVEELNSYYVDMVEHMVRTRPHLNQVIQDGGNIVGAVYRQYAMANDLQRLQDGPSACLLWYGEGFTDPYGHWYERTNNIERCMLLGVVYNQSDENQPERWLWPPEDVWLASGRFALRALHESDLDFVQSHARLIASGQARPKTRCEWTRALRMGGRRRPELRAAEAVSKNVALATYDLWNRLGWDAIVGLWDLDQFTESVADAMDNTKTDKEEASRV
jgi:hypothetical protein